MSNIVSLFRRRSGQQDKFVSLLEPHVALMYRMAWRWTRSPQDAEDLVQEVLITLAGRIDELQRIDRLRPWLIKITYRRYIDLYRKQARSPEINESSFSEFSHHSGVSLLDHFTAADTIGQLELTDSLTKALARLDADQQDVINLHDAEGYSAAEVAEILDISIGTVKSRLHRARQKLKYFLLPGTFPPSPTCQGIEELKPCDAMKSET